MNHDNQTTCGVFLVGYLTKIPELKMDAGGDFIATFTIRRKKMVYNTQSQSTDELVLSHRIFVSGEPALRVRQSAFVGLCLWIEGDFGKHGEIVAEKIGFLDFPESGGPAKIIFIPNQNELPVFQPCVVSGNTRAVIVH